jgi:hypothetical protein
LENAACHIHGEARIRLRPPSAAALTTSPGWSGCPAARAEQQKQYRDTMSIEFSRIVI